MPRNGAGTYNRSNGVNTGATVWATDAATGVRIVTGRHDSHDQDIADALTASIANDGQTPILADLPMSGFKHTGVALGTARTEYATVGQLSDSTNSYGGVSTGSSNAFAIALTPAITAYTDGMRIHFYANHSTTGAATLNVNGVGAAAIIKGSSTVALATGDILSGNLVEVVYQTSTSSFKLIPSISEWFTFTPDYTQIGTMTYGSITTHTAEFRYEGASVKFNIHATGTTGGTAVEFISVGLPVASMNTQFAPGITLVDGGIVSGTATVGAAQRLDLRGYDAANFGLGAGRQIIVTGNFIPA